MKVTRYHCDGGYVGKKYLLLGLWLRISLLKQKPLVSFLTGFNKVRKNTLITYTLTAFVLIYQREYFLNRNIHVYQCIYGPCLSFKSNTCTSPEPNYSVYFHFNLQITLDGQILENYLMHVFQC